MRKALGIALCVAGALCLIAALGLWGHNMLESAGAGMEADSRVVILQDYMNREIDPDSVTVIDSAHSDDDEDGDPVVYLDGYDYIGYIEIPAIKIKLPVMATWDYEKLRLSPCRQFGSAKDGDLVIAAHNYATHFGKLGTVIAGDEIRFTDMDGNVYVYEVKLNKVVNPENVSEVSDSGYDLVLYTCTKGGAKRIGVFCELVEIEAASDAQKSAS